MLKKSAWAALFVLATLSFSSNVHAEGSVFTIDVSDAVLQLTVPQTASIELNPTSSVASFGSANIPIVVATNNITGYTLIMSVPTTDLVHSTLSNTVIPTLSSASTEANFPANAWGYKVAGNDYLPVLASNAPAGWSSDGPTNGTNYTLTLAAKVDGAKPSGNYENTISFNLVAIPNALKDTIVFDGNGADSGSMTNQLIYQGELSKLNANAYTKDGYLFNGWNTTANGRGVGYGDEENYTSVISDSAKTITLYAQWMEDTGQGAGYAGRSLQAAFEQAYVNNPGQFPKDEGGYKHGLYVPHKNAQGEYDGTYFEATQQSDYDGIPANDLRFAIQDIGLLVDGQNVCKRTTAIGTEANVLDLRDNKSYWIVKLADGKCWMAQNLDFDIPVSGMTSEYSDLNVISGNGYESGYSQDENGVITYMPVRGTGAIIDFDRYDGYDYRTPYSADLGNIYQICTSSACPSEYLSTPGGLYGTHGHVGNAYNANAAIASNNSDTLNYPTYNDAASLNPQNSICPKNWRLPIQESDTVDEFNTIVNLYTTTNTTDRQLLAAPVYAVRAGRVQEATGWGQSYAGEWDGLGTSGAYWGSTSYNKNNYYYPPELFTRLWSFHNGTNGSSISGSRRYAGYSVRCVAR